MRDFKHEIDHCDDPNDLREILNDLAAEVEFAYDSPYENEAFLRRAHDLELLLRYGEHKLAKLLA